jgi:hypothetical protein
MVGAIPLDDRAADGVGAQHLDQVGEWHELERGYRFGRVGLSNRVQKRAARIACAVDAHWVEERLALALNDRDGPLEVERHAQHEAGELGPVATVPEAGLKPWCHGLARSSSVLW